MNRPLEPTSLDDPPPRMAGKVHPATASGPEKMVAEAGIVHPAPLTFAQTFGAVFLAILAAWLVISIVGAIVASIQEDKRNNKEVDELLHHR
jgi:hypothetical protein